MSDSMDRLGRGRRLAGGALAAAAVLSMPALARAQSLPPGYVEVKASDVKWSAHPTVAGAQLAVLVGDPTKPGPFVMRVKFPPGTRVPPHTHPDERTYTVLAGEWRLGFGERFDAAALRSFDAGSLYRLPAKAAHFQEAGAAETIIQINSTGPTSTDLIRR
jgi:quercetin dioxygenase-like cupin family protein